jgi:hypothetical protein
VISRTLGSHEQMSVLDLSGYKQPHEVSAGRGNDRML